MNLKSYKDYEHVNFYFYYLLQHPQLKAYKIAISNQPLCKPQMEVWLLSNYALINSKLRFACVQITV